MGNRVANGRSDRWRNHWQLRRLLYLGAMGVIAARRRKPAGDDWLRQLLERKPVKLVAIALASRTARTVWACSDRVRTIRRRKPEQITADQQ